MKKIILFIAVISLTLNVNAVEQCLDVYDKAAVALNNIQQQLEKVDSKNAYEQNVKARFDTVGALLKSSETCEKPTQMQAQFIEGWQQMYRALTSLQATAQLCAFSGFSNWVESKEQDLTVFKYAKSVSRK